MTTPSRRDVRQTLSTALSDQRTMVTPNGLQHLTDEVVALVEQAAGAPTTGPARMMRVHFQQHNWSSYPAHADYRADTFRIEANQDLTLSRRDGGQVAAFSFGHWLRVETLTEEPDNA